MSKPILEIVHRHFPNINKPFSEIPELALLVEFSTTSELDIITDSSGESIFQKRIIKIMSMLIDKDLIEDAIISKSDYQNKELWDIRENANVAQMQEGFQLKLDISIPINKMPDFWIETIKEIKISHNKVKICVFGHLGDGNLHYNLMDKFSEDPYVYKNREILKEFIYEKVKKFNGSFSAEHGIGQLKIKELKKYKEKNTLELMKKIKSSFDPKNILNPGKIFD